MQLPAFGWSTSHTRKPSHSRRPPLLTRMPTGGVDVASLSHLLSQTHTGRLCQTDMEATHSSATHTHAHPGTPNTTQPTGGQPRRLSCKQTHTLQMQAAARPSGNTAVARQSRTAQPTPHPRNQSKHQTHVPGMLRVKGRAEDAGAEAWQHCQRVRHTHTWGRHTDVEQH